MALQIPSMKLPLLSCCCRSYLASNILQLAEGSFVSLSCLCNKFGRVEWKSASDRQHSMMGCIHFCRQHKGCVIYLPVLKESPAVLLQEIAEVQAKLVQSMHRASGPWTAWSDLQKV